MKLYFFKPDYEFNKEIFCQRIHIDGDSASDQDARERLPGLLFLAKRNMGLTACFLEGDREFETGCCEADACEKQFICLVYSSKKINDIMERFSQKGEYLNAWLLHALADELIFHASEQLNETLYLFCQSEKKYLTAPFFPGDDGVSWDLQTSCLSLIKKVGEIPVNITRGHMLDPEKSLLFIRGADALSTPGSGKHDCKNCLRKNCSYRSEWK